MRTKLDVAYNNLSQFELEYRTPNFILFIHKTGATEREKESEREQDSARDRNEWKIPKMTSAKANNNYNGSVHKHKPIVDIFRYCCCCCCNFVYFFFVHVNTVYNEFTAFSASIFIEFQYNSWKHTLQIKELSSFRCATFGPDYDGNEIDAFTIEKMKLKNTDFFRKCDINDFFPDNLYKNWDSQQVKSRLHTK